MSADIIVQQVLENLQKKGLMWQLEVYIQKLIRLISADLEILI
jgi:hypothetical protein